MSQELDSDKSSSAIQLDSLIKKINPGLSGAIGYHSPNFINYNPKYLETFPSGLYGEFFLDGSISKYLGFNIGYSFWQAKRRYQIFDNDTINEVLYSGGGWRWGLSLTPFSLDNWLFMLYLNFGGEKQFLGTEHLGITEYGVKVLYDFKSYGFQIFAKGAGYSASSADLGGGAKYISMYIITLGIRIKIIQNN
jgi:hypothetical protein